MSTVVKDLGAVSAYAYAVEKGYTGTEAEFAELMADYAEVGQRAEDAADSALESKTAAQTAATTATNKASEATTAAQTATTKAGEASTSASTATSAKDTAVSASQTATTKATEATTAAATATSAATTATTAKDDAVSAKTAAQTAQTGAETAAASVQSSAAQIATNAEDISQLKSDLNIADNKLNDLAVYPNLANPNVFVNDKYMAPNGSVYSSTALFYTGKISVQEGQIIKANHRARFITAFSDSTAIEESGVNDASGDDIAISYTVPSGINGLVFTFKNVAKTDLMIYVYDGTDYGYIPYGEMANIKIDIFPTPLKVITSKENRPIYKETSGISFVANTFIALPIFSCTRKNTRLVYRANISSLGNFEIGFTTAANSSGTKYNRFVITQNCVIAYLRYDYTTSAMVSESVNHDLNITRGSLQIVIEERPNATVTITIENNGNTWNHTFDGYVKNNTLQPYCYSAYGAFANYKFVWSCTDLDKKIWFFGDSYMAYSDARWPYYLEQYGYAKNALFNSFPGCWSSTAITALNSLINYGNPKYIVWAMGMNDGSDSESAPSTSWANNRDSFIAICEENNIEPIFCTIPTVPTVNNEQKNAWIKSSGYRYINFARAVNASASGVWSAGTLSGDGVHPTVNGAKALFAELLLDFPEIMQGLDGNYQ